MPPRHYRKAKIAPSAVRAFLDRKLDTHEWIKDCTADDLHRALSEVLPPPHFHTTPKLHQLAAFFLAIHHKRFALFMDMGTGKTWVALNAIKYRIGNGDVKRALVLVPNLLSIDSWVREAAKHAPDLHVVGLEGSSVERWAAVAAEEQGNPDRLMQVAVINYAGLVAMLCDLQADPKGKKQGRTRVVNLEKLRRFHQLFDMLVCDESQNIQSRESTSYKLLNALSKKATAVMPMTGTPFGRDAQSIWPQMYVCDRGDTLGPTLGIFRAAFFIEKDLYWGGSEWKLDPRHEADLHRALQHRSIRYRAEDCLDLPERVAMRRYVALPKAAEEYYRRELDKFKASRGNWREMENSFIRMRQLAAGFMSLHGDDGDKVQVEFDENPKVEALLEMADALPDGHKMVVFHDFIFSGTIISKALKQAGHKHARIYGGTSDKRGELAKFLDDPTYRLLVINSASGGAVLNLQVANYEVFYESPVPAIVRQQAERRCWRQGQQHTTFITDLVMRDTVDEKILGFNEEGRDLLRALMDGGEQLDGGARGNGQRRARSRRY